MASIALIAAGCAGAQGSPHVGKGCPLGRYGAPEADCIATCVEQRLAAAGVPVTARFRRPPGQADVPVRRVAELGGGVKVQLGEEAIAEQLPEAFAHAAQATTGCSNDTLRFQTPLTRLPVGRRFVLRAVQGDGTAACAAFAKMDLRTCGD